MGLILRKVKLVFNDSFAITIDDPDHSDLEERYIDIGISFKERILVVWYTERDEKRLFVRGVLQSFMAHRGFV